MVLRHVPAALLICLAAFPAAAQDVKTILGNVSKAMGAENLKTLRYSGTGSVYINSRNADSELQRTQARLKSYTYELDLNVPVSRVQMVRVEGTPPADQTRTVLAAAATPWESQLDIWLNPFGFLKGAMANSTTAETQTIRGRKYTVLTFTIQNNLVSAFIDENHLIDSIQTRVTDPVLGETPVEAGFVEYKVVEGVKFPTGLSQKRGGLPVLIVVAEDVKPNAPVSIPAPTR